MAYYRDSARDLLAENQAALEPGGFVSGEWQSYSFFYFLLGADWLLDRIKLLVEIRQALRKIDVDVPAVRAELDQIAQLADQA